MLDQNQNLKQYLLGDLSDKEIEKIDLEIISDESLEETLLFSEHDVIEDYLEGTLSQNEVELFYKNFLISPDREKLVAEIAGLKRFARKAKMGKTSSNFSNDSDPSFFNKLRRILTLQPAKAVFTILLIGAFFGVILFTVFNQITENDQTPLEMEYAELNKKDFSDLEKYKEFTRFDLISGSTRGFNDNKKFNKTNISDKIFMRLALPANLGFEEVFNIEIEQNGIGVFTQNGIYPYKNPNGEELRILVPKSIIKTGDYIIKAKNSKTSEIVYAFTVE